MLARVCVFAVFIARIGKRAVWRRLIRARMFSMYDLPYTPGNIFCYIHGNGERDRGCLGVLTCWRTAGARIYDNVRGSTVGSAGLMSFASARFRAAISDRCDTRTHASKGVIFRAYGNA